MFKSSRKIYSLYFFEWHGKKVTVCEISMFRRTSFHINSVSGIVENMSSAANSMKQCPKDLLLVGAKLEKRPIDWVVAVPGNTVKGN